MNDAPPTLKFLIFHWGDAYIFAYARDRWLAIRRDGLLFLAAGTLAQLETEIGADYEKTPVPREYDPPDPARDYLTTDPVTNLEATDEFVALAVHAAEAIVFEAAENLTILSELRALFPGWDIEYCHQANAWIATRNDLTICENSPLFIHIALTMINQKRDPGGDRPPPG